MSGDLDTTTAVTTSRTRRDVVTRLLVATALYRPAKAELNAAYDEARTCGLLDSPGTRDIGLLADEQIGYVLVEEGPWEVRIDDPQALSRWTEERGLTFRQVECALFSFKELGFWLNEATEATEVLPGVVRQRSDRRYLRVKPTDDALATIQAAKRAVRWGPLEALAEAVADFRASSGGQVGECRDAVVAVAVALADELEAGQR